MDCYKIVSFMATGSGKSEPVTRPVQAESEYGTGWLHNCIHIGGDRSAVPNPADKPEHRNREEG